MHEDVYCVCKLTPNLISLQKGKTGECSTSGVVKHIKQEPVECGYPGEAVAMEETAKGSKRIAAKKAKAALVNEFFMYISFYIVIQYVNIFKARTNYELDYYRIDFYCIIAVLIL